MGHGPCMRATTCMAGKWIIHAYKACGLCMAAEWTIHAYMAHAQFITGGWTTHTRTARGPRMAGEWIIYARTAHGPCKCMQVESRMRTWRIGSACLPACLPACMQGSHVLQATLALSPPSGPRGPVSANLQPKRRAACYAGRNQQENLQLPRSVATNKKTQRPTRNAATDKESCNQQGGLQVMHWTQNVVCAGGKTSCALGTKPQPGPDFRPADQTCSLDLQT
eukprot:364046-Chlamydomonas_euryale.AAC.8